MSFFKVSRVEVFLSGNVCESQAVAIKLSKYAFEQRV